MKTKNCLRTSFFLVLFMSSLTALAASTTNVQKCEFQAPSLASGGQPFDVSINLQDTTMTLLMANEAVPVGAVSRQNFSAQQMTDNWNSAKINFSPYLNDIDSVSVGTGEMDSATITGNQFQGGTISILSVNDKSNQLLRRVVLIYVGLATGGICK